MFRLGSVSLFGIILIAFTSAASPPDDPTRASTRRCPVQTAMAVPASF